MDPAMFTEGEEVRVRVRSRKRGGQSYDGIVFGGRYPHMYLYLSVGGTIRQIPWAQVLRIERPSR